MGDNLDQKPEPAVPFINIEPEEEEDAKEMTPNIRVGFKER